MRCLRRKNHRGGKTVLDWAGGKRLPSDDSPRDLHETRPDLSPYLVHFTKGEDAFGTLEKILEPNADGFCELKGSTSGLFVKAAQKDPQLDYLVQAVSLTETPFEHLQYFTRSYSNFGIAFEKDFVIRNGGNPVFYISTEHSAQLKKAALDLIKIKDYEKRDLTYLLPFFSIFGRDAAGRPIDYYWEREWRVPQSLRFRHEDVLLGFCEDNPSLDYFTETFPGVPFVCPEWSNARKLAYLKGWRTYD